MEDFKNYIPEFLKQQEILHIQDMEKLQKQRQEDLERFSELLETLSRRENDPGSSNTFFQNSVINSIGEFVYKPDEEVTFGPYFRRYEEIFQKDCNMVGWKKKSTIITG